jgi:hypothetical protein
VAALVGAAIDTRWNVLELVFEVPIPADEVLYTVLVDNGRRDDEPSDTGNRGSRFEDPGLRIVQLAASRQGTALAERGRRSSELEETGRTLTLLV